MKKVDYLKIIKEIEELERRFLDLDEESKDYEYQINSIAQEVRFLNLDSIKINIAIPQPNEKTVSYVVLGSEYECPTIYEMPESHYKEIVQTLYQIYTNYDSKYLFYKNVGIELENLIALIINCKGLPITAYKTNVTMNDIRYWNSCPNNDSLLSIVGQDNLQSAITL